MRKILEACPTCGSEMVISEVTCTTCDTVVRSRYTPCPFCRLAPKDLAFMLLFVRSRGNVKDMERELGVSYWTIRGRLNEIIDAMGLDAMGLDAVGLDTRGLDARGLDARGLDARGLDARGLDASGVAAGGADSGAVADDAATAGKGSGRASAAAGRSSVAQAILARLQRGEISAQEAAELLARQ